MASITWHYVLKFIITGDAAVGKSSLLVQLTDHRFLTNPDPTLGVEFGSKLIEIPEQGKVIKLQSPHALLLPHSSLPYPYPYPNMSLLISPRPSPDHPQQQSGWDTAGSEKFRSITRSYYRGAAGCLLVYDVTNRASFLNARSWLADVREFADPHLTCILVGNKVDLCDDDTTTGPPNPNSDTSNRKRRQVSKEEGQLWAEEEGLLFVEASAKSGRNVDWAFEQASRDILDKIKRGVFDDNRSPGVKLSKPSDDGVASSKGGPKKQGCCS